MVYGVSGGANDPQHAYVNTYSNILILSLSNIST